MSLKSGNMEDGTSRLNWPSICSFLNYYHPLARAAMPQLVRRTDRHTWLSNLQQLYFHLRLNNYNETADSQIVVQSLWNLRVYYLCLFKGITIYFTN